MKLTYSITFHARRDNGEEPSVSDIDALTTLLLEHSSIYVDNKPMHEALERLGLAMVTTDEEVVPTAVSS